MTTNLSDRETELLLATMELDGRIAADWFTLLIAYKKADSFPRAKIEQEIIRVEQLMKRHEDETADFSEASYLQMKTRVDALTWVLKGCEMYG